MKRVIAITATVLGAAAALHPAAAAAQISDSWQFQGSIYGYLPTMTIDSMLPNGITTESKFDARTILDHLKFTFMGALEAQKGRWGAFTDVIYMNVGNGRAKTRDFTLGGVQLPAGVTASTSMDMKAVVWTLAGSYRFVASPEGTLDVLAGARMLDIKQTLDWQLTGDVGSISIPLRSGRADVKGNNWDAIIGVKGQVALGTEGTWFMPYYADIGTGESDLTTQLMAGVGYRFKWGDIVATWRYLDWNNKEGKPLQGLNLNGPLLAVTFHW